MADALDVIFHRGEVGETYNIGSNFEISNLEFASRLIRIFGYKMEDHVEFVQDRAFNDKRYGVDCSKLEGLGWKPKMDFEGGLRKTSKFLSFLLVLRECLFYPTCAYASVCVFVYRRKEESSCSCYYIENRKKKGVLSAASLYNCNPRWQEY